MKGGGGIDLVGCTDRVQRFRNEWNPPRPTSVSVQTRGRRGREKKEKG